MSPSSWTFCIGFSTFLFFPRGIPVAFWFGHAEKDRWKQLSQLSALGSVLFAVSNLSTVWHPLPCFQNRLLAGSCSHWQCPDIPIRFIKDQHTTSKAILSQHVPYLDYLRFFSKIQHCWDLTDLTNPAPSPFPQSCQGPFLQVSKSSNRTGAWSVMLVLSFSPFAMDSIDLACGTQ